MQNLSTGILDCVVDIETWFNPALLEVFADNIKAPKNIKDHEKIKKAIEEKQAGAKQSMMVDIDYATIKMIAWKEGDKDAIIISLKTLSAILDEHKENGQMIRLITFNGKSFDLPIIIRQAIVNKIDLPFYKLKRACEKFANDGYLHTDMMEVLGKYGAYKSQDKYMQIYLGEKKDPIDFMTCTTEELEKHALADVTKLYELYKMFNKII